MKINPIGHLVKTNPIQTQSPSAIRDTQYAIRNTQYAIRNTQYEIQTQFKNQTNAAAFDKLTKKRIISALVTQSAKQAVV